MKQLLNTVQPDLSQDKGYNVSEKYKVINTAEILSQFENAGYTVTKVQKAKVRDPLKQGYQKHLIRLSHPDTQFKIDGVRPEVILKNAYDGSTSFNLRIGVYRLICANGLEVGSTFQSETVRHLGNHVLEKVLEAAERIKLGFPEVQEQIKIMSQAYIGDYTQKQLASQIATVLQPNARDFNLQDLLAVRRTGDISNDLFTVLNRIQENALLGSYRYTTEVTETLTNVTKLVDRRGRRITSIDRTSEVNQAVWDAALKIVA
jgi:hypothetical protein